MVSARERYERIAPFYDLLDLAFEHMRYRALRPLLFAGLAGHILDAGVGTGRNMTYYPPGATVVGIDLSPAMLARARLRLKSAACVVTLREMDVTNLEFPAAMFDAAVSSFLFCVLPDAMQRPALCELARVVRPGGLIRLLEYVRPQGKLRNAVAGLWEPWMAWAFGAGFDRNTEAHVASAGLELVETRYVSGDILKLLTIRVPA